MLAPRKFLCGAESLSDAIGSPEICLQLTQRFLLYGARAVFLSIRSQIFRPAYTYIVGGGKTIAKIGIIPQCNPPVAIFTFCSRPLWKSRSALRTLVFAPLQIPAARCFYFLRFSAFPQVESVASLSLFVTVIHWMNAALISETGERISLSLLLLVPFTAHWIKAHEQLSPSIFS